MLETLPAELLERILQWLELTCLVRMSQVNSRLRELVALRHYQPFLLAQEFSVTKQLRSSGWSEQCEDPQLIINLFWKVSRGLRVAWTEGRPSQREKVVGIWIPGDPGSYRVTDTALYRDKLYLGLETCSVDVYDLERLERLHSLEGSEAPLAGADHLTRSCQLALCQNTLAVSSADRRKVRLYNCDSDEMVGEIETRLGPIYNLAINNRLLVCLSGWTCLSWRIDASRPDTVRGRFQGMFPDFEPSDEFQNWLEVHAAVMNPNYLVTRATRTRILHHEAQSAPRSVSFIHVRRLGPDGFIGPVLRPGDTALDQSVVEVNTMCLSDTNLLALLVMSRQESESQAGVYYLRYIIQVMDIDTGNILAALPTQSILSSVQMPVCWRDGKLYVKIVPKPEGGFFSGSDEDEVYQVSLACWDLEADSLNTVPAVQISSSSDHVNIEQSRLVVISTKFSHRPFNSFEADINLETVAELEQFNPHNTNPETGPRFTVKAALYDFWNLEC